MIFTVLVTQAKKRYPRSARLYAGCRDGLKVVLYRLLIRFLRTCESLWGPDSISWLLVPTVSVDFLRRLCDYRQFKRLRAVFPSEFWPISPLRHYLRMIRTWQGTLYPIMVYDRLGSPAWKKRLTVRGTPPNQLPTWGERPVIVTFLHTGGFGILRYWLRAQGIPTASFIGSMPNVIGKHAQKIRDAGDAQYGLGGLPHTFEGAISIRNAVRFLVPGRAMTVALDGRPISLDLPSYNVKGRPIHLKDGAFRIAMLTNAVIVPVSVHRKGPSHFEFCFGNPVPDEWLREGKSREAIQHLIDEIWKYLGEDPASIGWSTLEAFAPELAVKRIDWP